MTIIRFAEIHKVSVNTVRQWIANGYIPGADEYTVPASARRPYTKTRAKKGDAIIKSILTACNKNLGICAALYGISTVQYNSYIHSLIEGGLITQFEDDGVEYYNITAKGVDLLKNWNKKDVIGIIQVAITAAAAAFL